MAKAYCKSVLSAFALYTALLVHNTKADPANVDGPSLP